MKTSRGEKTVEVVKYPVGAVKVFNPVVGEFTNEPTVDKENNPNGHVEYRFINLTNEQSNQLADIERNLREVHDVSSFQIVTYPYSEKVQSYQKDLSLAFERKGINYYFDCFSIRLVATESDVDERLKENEWMIERNYMRKYLSYTVEKAEKRQDKYNQETWGELEEINPVKQLLANKTYVNEYENTLKHSVLPNRQTVL
ncbi:hypothetical protein QWY16_07605 [Planococcus shenhongbingii]|uniref:hypothetical protein n=1 Tax=Planococcus shenhongbingii TaxID=3058398 RepID=UPI002628FBC9|nr:hypothetical protein [Planococcus sp. N016]WKA59962.1 hypothetical protein QWY16_07605 [Planococcus sp. N016]